ncbi:MAG: hypothetical protein R2744_01635 [Bacteroidales bacterium]
MVVSSIASRVVPGMSETIALSSLSNPFSRVDFLHLVCRQLLPAIRSDYITYAE